MNQWIKTDFDETNEIIKGKLRVEENFDILYRVFEIGGRKACFYFIDGFTGGEVMEKIMDSLLKITKQDMPDNIHDFAKKKMPYGEIEILDDDEKFVKLVMAGMTGLYIEGYDQVLIFDIRNYPCRSVDEPERDKTLRGSKDGFIETLVWNAALIRRRIRNVDLSMELYSVGRSSKTDVVVAYMKSRAEEKMVKEIIRRIQKIKIDALTMSQESLLECLYQHKWFNPFPKFKFTERPDTTAACLLEGSIVILVDNSPSAMIIPTSVFDIIETADDYYFPPITGTYLRLSRFIINILAVVLTPLFLLLMGKPEWVPEPMEYILIKDPINVPIILQFLILEFAIDGLRLASVSTPSMLNTPLSVVAGIVLGDYSVSSGWFNSEIMLYMAFVAVANYTQNNFELGYALKFMRLILLIVTHFFGIYGFIGGLLFIGVSIVSNKTILGKSYIYPLIPFDFKQLARRFFRVSLPKDEQARR